MAERNPFLDVGRAPSNPFQDAGSIVSAGGRKLRIKQAENRKMLRIEQERKNRRKWASRNRDRPTFMQLTPYKPGTGDSRLVKVKNPFYRPPTRRAAGPGGPSPSAPDLVSQVEDSPLEIAAPIFEGGPSQSSLGLNLSDVFQPPAAINPAALLAPSARMLERQRKDTEAARQKGATDIQAFNEWLGRQQQATQGGLATELGRIGQQAAQTRSESLGRLNAATQAAVTSAMNPDLMRSSGLGAQIQSGLSGQLASDAEAQSLQAVQGGLATRTADQQRVDAALASGLPVELSRAYNQRLRELQDKESELSTALANLRFEDVKSRREYATEQAGQAIAARTAEVELGQKYSAQQIDAWKTAIQEQTKRSIANQDRKLTALVEQGKLSSNEADRRLKRFTEGANRQSREKVAILQSQTSLATSGTTGSKAATDIDQLASTIANNIPMFGLDAMQLAGQQRKGATQFVKAARTRHGGQVPWTTIRNVLDTYFPEFSADEKAVGQLRQYWGR